MTEAAPLGRSRFLTVARVINEADDAVSLVFKVPEEDRSHFAYQPGQFLTIRIPSDQTGSVSRCYSIASSPYVDDELKVTVKRTQEGYGSNWLCDNAMPGEQLQVLAPGGVFTPHSFDGEFLLLAAGSGITPIMSILKSALSQGSDRITLIYANRNETSVIFAEELNQLARQHPDRLGIVHWLETVQGLPSAELLQGLIAHYSGAQAFMCGPKPFMAAASQALSAIGVPRDHQHKEVFLSLSGDSFAEVTQLAQPASQPLSAEVESALEAALDAEPGLVETAPASKTVTARVTLKGKTSELAWPEETRLTDVMLENGLDAPYSCREGECGTCIATLSSGTVRMVHNEVLDDDDVADGSILTCQSVSVGTDIDVTF